MDTHGFNCNAYATVYIFLLFFCGPSCCQKVGIMAKEMKAVMAKANCSLVSFACLAWYWLRVGQGKTARDSGLTESPVLSAIHSQQRQSTHQGFRLRLRLRLQLQSACMANKTNNRPQNWHWQFTRTRIQAKPLCVCVRACMCVIIKFSSCTSALHLLESTRLDSTCLRSACLASAHPQLHSQLARLDATGICLSVRVVRLSVYPSVRLSSCPRSSWFGFNQLENRTHWPFGLETESAKWSLMNVSVIGRKLSLSHWRMQHSNWAKSNWCNGQIVRPSVVFYLFSKPLQLHNELSS